MNINNARGFSLLEVLLAFSILALSLGVILEIFARGNKTAAIGETYSIAAIIAESKLASVQSLEVIQSHVSTGTELERYHWELSLQPYEEENDNVYINENILYETKVVVQWDMAGKTHKIELNSLRLLTEPL